MPGSRLLPLLLLAASAAAARPTYLITTPENIHPGLNVTLGISLLTGSQPEVRVTAEIMEKNTTVLRGEGLFQTGSFGTLVLPALPMNSVADRYTLHVNGYAEDQLIFSNSTPLEFERKGCFVFIQTDKSLYKPGQEVKMRIVTVLIDLRPYKATLDIRIKDPRGNIIEQWLEEEGDLGVASLNFQLSAHPPLGDWSIQVQVNRQTHFQTFTVMEYVLPKFEVLIARSSHHSMNEDKLTGIITAKYTYGKPVKGNAMVVISSDLMKRHIKKTYQISGSVTFTFDYEELITFFATDEQRFGVRSSTFDIIAVVTESLTGISQNTSSRITFAEQDYAIEFSDYNQVLKPSLNFTAKVKIMRYDNSLLNTEERRNNVVVTVFQFERIRPWNFFNSEIEQNQNSNMQLTNYSIPENGIIQIEVPLMSDTRHLQIQASFLSVKNEIAVKDVFNSPTMAYIQIQREAQELKVGMPFELIIHSNKPIMELNYQVLSRGQIVAVGKKSLSNFTLTPESSWTPVALIIVFYIQDDGEVVNDVMSFAIQPVFENKVSMSWSRAVARPSEKVSLTLTGSESNSLIGLSVADKSVKLLGDRNDITAKNVIHELEDFSKLFDGVIRNSLDVFEKCHLNVLTDANLIKGDNWIDNNGDFKYYDYYLFNSEASLDDIPMNRFEENNIPPLGEYPGPSSPNIRLFFPETWLWMDIKTGRGTDANLNVTVPDTITTWVANAFIISEHLGLGMATAPVQLQVFQPFFVYLNLPYSVTRGEQFVVEVVIFNYLEVTSQVTVTLVPSDAFDIIITSNDINVTGNNNTVSVPRHDGKTVMFPVKTNQLGEIDITVKATSPAASDAVTQKVLVKAEGTEQFFSQTILVDLTNHNAPPVTETLTFMFPSNVVSGSERVFIAAVGDILGPSINGLESLIHMPYGCGEQNMIHFAPNIYILDYLTKTKQLTDETSRKSILFMKEGYQRELLYQRDDGSFSAFGNLDTAGSTWLSSFVLRCFLQARAFVNIDPSVLQKTITWIFRYQKRSGEFWEPGRILNTNLIGGINSPVTLTAYIASAIAEYPGHEESSQFRSAINYLEYKMDEAIADNYTLAIVTYALSLAGSSKAKKGLNILNSRAEQQGDLRFWSTISSKLSNSWQPSATDIELAAYALLSHVQQKRVAEGIPVMKWLSKQRNNLGGFSSTQDTILALQALSTIASLATIGKTEISVSVNGPHFNNTVEFMIDNLNRFLLQTQEIAVEQPLAITVSAHGIGLAVFQLNVFYNVKEEVTARSHHSVLTQEAFDLDISVQDNNNDINHMTLNVCTRFLGTDTTSESGMALMQVNFLSGFALSPDSISLNSAIKKVENGIGNVNLYFDSLNDSQICVAIPAVRDSKVAYTQEASVSVVDYYEPRRRASRSYNSEVMQKLSPCVFCEECDSCLKDGSIGMMHHSKIFLLLFIVHLIL